MRFPSVSKKIFRSENEWKYRDIVPLIARIDHFVVSSHDKQSSIPLTIDLYSLYN